eukprot:gb/GECG01005344.1/.p1 GENE.gb/GECG01005344.1/~~gb/GECG01005344.1/.p1  ORF type:complete len:636 (+),score=51.49 gb/GECG01005344.1/:1-1908(+)
MGENHNTREKKRRRRSIDLQSSMQDPEQSARTLFHQMSAPDQERFIEDLINLKYGYVTLLREMKKRMPKLPDVSIHLRDVCHEFKLAPENESPQNFIHAAYNTLRWIFPPVWWSSVRSWWKQEGYHKFRNLDDCSATFSPGTMTLMVAPPGHGKSSLLKAIAGRLPDSEFSGTIKYSGMRKHELPASLNKLVGYVDQQDIHYPNLTVRETLEFACESCVVREQGTHEPSVQEVLRRRVDTLVKLLSLEDCQHTRVGDETSRGISGGEKRRLTIGEVLVARARVLLLDEVTNGLDSSVAYKLLRSIRTWCSTMDGTVVASVLTPSPEILELFDNLLLLRNGKTIFHGDRQAAIEFFRSHGIEKPDSQDEASFIMEALSDPDQKLDRPRTPHVAENERREPTEILTQVTPTEESADERSPSSIKEPLKNDYTSAQYGRNFAQTCLEHTRLCLNRQAKLVFRNIPFLGFRIFQASFIGLLVGVFFWDLDETDFQLKLGIIPYGATSLAFVGMAEIPVISSERPVVQKQLKAKMYPVISYTLALVVAELPIAALEALFIGTPLYWMTDLSDEAGRFFFLLLIYFLTKVAVGMWFKAVAVGSSTADVAQSQGSVLVGILVPLGGYVNGLRVRKNLIALYP